MGETAEVATVAHGYSMADVDRIARSATSTAKSWSSMDYSERFEAAWFGVVDALLASDERPESYALMSAGMREISRASDDYAHHHGLRGEGVLREKFQQYWLPRTMPSESFADPMIERLALPQVLGRLTPGEYEAVVALAMYGNQKDAATAIGIAPNAFSARVQAARKRIQSLWFEHETPQQGTGKGRGDDERCSHGHLRSEHGYKIQRVRNGVPEMTWRCRLCIRTSDRNSKRRRARVAA